MFLCTLSFLTMHLPGVNLFLVKFKFRCSCLKSPGSTVSKPAFCIQS